MNLWQIQFEMEAELDSAAQNRHHAGCRVHVTFVLNAPKTRDTFHLFPFEVSVSNRAEGNVHLQMHYFCSQQRLSTLRAANLAVVDRLSLLGIARDSLLVQNNGDSDNILVAFRIRGAIVVTPAWIGDRSPCNVQRRNEIVAIDLVREF
jgi:hypothetical protein